MNEARLFLIHHGAPIVFVAVLIEQLGLPLPALPWLLAAGALAAAGQFNLPLAILMSMLACLAADSLWFYLGRYQGAKVLGLLCRISLEPDSCVRRTQNVFTKYGWRGIVIAKFVPGLSTLAPPLAGMSKMNAARFLAVDGAGSLLYGGCFIGVGYFFSNQLQQIMGALSNIGASALALIGAAVAAYLGYKYWQRKRLLDDLRMARITVADLRQMMNAGQPLVILDMRSSVESASEAGIEGAIHLTMDDIKLGRYQFPRDREVVVYCSCPNEVTAARVALLLRRHGFTHVRPLLGGIDAWNGQAAPATA
ncbi:MAG TPA: DedA family protein/thiosulfate sulfurtransferase GlpE [Verrucomicrobiae bacterium]|jgi:membrane protein DedA with SNARE-associated domain/rhodanese-related sulfurtransferase